MRISRSQSQPAEPPSGRRGDAPLRVDGPRSASHHGRHAYADAVHRTHRPVLRVQWFAIVASALACGSVRIAAQAPAPGNATQEISSRAVGRLGSSVSPAINAAAWLAYDGDHPLSSRLKLFFDASLRRAGAPAGVGQWQQTEALAGLSLAATSRWTVTAGAGAVRTYAYGERPMPGAEPEQRLWSQLQWSGAAVGSTLALRTRLEHRWIKHSEAMGRRPLLDRRQYTARIVPEVRVSVPIGQGPWYVTGAAEVFHRVLPQEPFVEQMRESAAVGYRVGPASRIEAGYLHQTLRFRTQSDERNHALHVVLRSATRWRR